MTNPFRVIFDNQPQSRANFLSSSAREYPEFTD